MPCRLLARNHWPLAKIGDRPLWQQATSFLLAI
jgi:hypothetical protein